MLLAIVPVRRSLLRKGAGSLHGMGDGTFLSPLSTSDNVEVERAAIKMLAVLVTFITAGYMFFREQLLGFGWDRRFLDWTDNPLVRSVGSDQLWMPLVLLGRYVALLVAPLKLSLDYGTHVIGWTVNWHQPYVYLGIATVIIASLLFVLFVRTGRRAAAFCIVALAVSYGMVSNAMVLIGTIFGERLMYMPSVFFIILVSVMLARFLKPAPLMATVVILASLGSVRTFTYARLWNDPLNLYVANLREFPLSARLHGLATYKYLSQGMPGEARAIAEDSRRRLPDCVQSYVMCVAADVALHDFDDADKVLRHVDQRASGIRIAFLAAEVRRRGPPINLQRRARKPLRKWAQI